MAEADKVHNLLRIRSDFSVPSKIAAEDEMANKRGRTVDVLLYISSHSDVFSALSSTNQVRSVF